MYEPQFRCRSNGVPILSHKDIESDAEMFIRDFDPDVLNNPKEVNIEEFAEFYLGLTPEYNNLTHCGLILGRMVFNDSNKVPVYDADAKRAEYIFAGRGTVMIDNTLLTDEHRFRSTMGHESGHWIYQQSYFTETRISWSCSIIWNKHQLLVENRHRRWGSSAEQWAQAVMFRS